MKFSLFYCIYYIPNEVKFFILNNIAADVNKVT